MPKIERHAYLIRAIYEWILDDGLTPYIAVNTDNEAIDVPGDIALDSEILLNISPTAVRDLELGNECVEFDTRFAGHPYHIMMPLEAVNAIFAKESGEGLVFLYNENGQRVVADRLSEAERPPPPPPKRKRKVSRPKRVKGPPKLKVVK